MDLIDDDLYLIAGVGIIKCRLLNVLHVSMNDDINYC